MDFSIVNDFQNSRLVILIPGWSLAVKFCRLPDFEQAWQTYTDKWTIWKGNPPGDVEFWHQRRKRTIFKHLWGTVAENWNEWRFYRRTRHPFLQPTYFSFFGLVNFQLLGNVFQMSLIDFRDQISRLQAETEPWDDVHHFTNPNNFCVDSDGRFRILDYGSPDAQQIILRFGNLIQERFTRKKEG